jgi:tetratricopeptide (TPR) repeat protein
MAYAVRALILFLLLAVAGGVSNHARAQTVKKPQASEKNAAAAKEAAEKKAAADAQRAYAAGSKAYESGKSAQAVQQLTAALRSGGLPTAQMARALYLRGLSYRKEGKPGLAISDLTSAIWLKNGLSATDRADAIAKRGEAYREAGLQDPGNGPGHVVVAGDPAPSSAAAPAPKPGVKSVTITSDNSSGGFFSWFGGGSSSSSSSSTGSTTPASAPTPAPAPAPKSSSWETATLSSAVSSTTTSRTASDVTTSMPPSSMSNASAYAPAPPAAAPAPPPAKSSSSSNTLFGAIGSMFSSGSSSQKQVPETTASAEHVSAVSSWSDSTEITVGNNRTAAAANTKVAAVARPAPAAAPQFTGKFRIQVAAVRSKEEATELANRLQQNHGSSLHGRTPSVDTAVLGTMGTFYRVRVGPYADASEPRKLCPALKADGFDCLIVSQ